ncbi:hypothetical protein EYE40_09670 [Glaciihabitans arcticus]|uniref:Uncharacterized protein n=1 Tax=Glaciihabitans arcticus TaxID=2668039 RepID=A0A4Q9GXY6_9MICO|nr:hypothetical protein [Glaciihabitans arcticus]TBN57633.1 hypothetical protein EYE40_09670 [Glaciihabitans arcticus]
MTDLLDTPESATTPSAHRQELDWIVTDVVAPAVWIGRYQGTFVGMIEERDLEGYTATTRLGRGLGNFETLEAAQEAFYRR